MRDERRREGRPGPGAAGGPGRGAHGLHGDADPALPGRSAAALLALSDMPAGYQVTSDNSSSSPSSPGPEVSSSDPGCQPLADLGASGKPPESVAGAQSPQFAATPDGPFIDENLAGYASPAAAQAFLDRLTKAIQSCKKFTETQPDGTKVDIGVSPLPFPAKGDAGSASRLGFTVQGQPVVADAVVSRVGSTLVAVINTALQNTDSALTSAVVDAAIAKVRNPAAAPAAPGASGSSV